MFLLATDLDGTFLGGSLHDRNVLYQTLRSLADQVLLVFVTGRALQNVQSLFADEAIPTPHYVIANVGATIVHGDTLQPMAPIDDELAARWLGETQVLEAIPEGLVLERQQQAQERRCSFYTDDHEVVAAVRNAVQPLGCEVLYSANRYLDVLASGISKGATLNKLVEHLKIDPACVLVAGDSLNDLSMFAQSDFHGVVVAGSEPALREATRSRARTHHAVRSGAGGILEAMQAFKFADQLTDRLTERAKSQGEAELVIAYHRQPFDESLEDGEVQRQAAASPNGIIPTLLGMFRQGRKGAWIAWSTCTSGNFEPRIQLEGFDNLTLSRLLLSQQDVDLFYRKLSKEALWPILHGFIERARFDHRHWQHFIDINQRFAHLAAAEAAADALVWVHDYNLWLVPHYLRRLRPDVRIAFFHHTPFPPADIFNVLPWSREIIGSLLCCDYIGFHIPRYCENFADVAASHYSLKTQVRQRCERRFTKSGSALCVENVVARIECGNRPVMLGAHPVGIDLHRISTSLKSEQFVRAARSLATDLKDKKVIVSAERLDYMKGPLQKLQAYERFLALYPAWREKITFIDICTPPAAGMDVYDDIRAQVEQAVGRINGRFSTPTWVPVAFMFRHQPFDMLAAYFALADVAWITPLRDGLNLVAKEYVAIRSELGKFGALIISEFAGASVELAGALLTNPYDITGMADTLHQALMMEEHQQRERMGRLAAVVRRYDVNRWAQDMIRCAGGNVDSQQASRPARALPGLDDDRPGIDVRDRRLRGSTAGIGS